MHPLEYPGTPATAAGVLTPGSGWQPLGDQAVPDDLVRGRTCVLAVGSNASPRVLDAKLVRAGVRTPVGNVAMLASWFDAAGLAALDATEPNYLRRQLGEQVAGGPRGAHAYVSRWGVLAPGGEPLSPRSQVEVHAVLAADRMLARLLPLEDPAATVAALRRPALQVRVRERMASAGWALPTGLDRWPLAQR